MKKPLNLKISRNTAGKVAEFICRLYMRLCGYQIIAKNYRCGTGKNTPFGELDFVAVRGKHIVFCEVKKRKRQEDFLKALPYKQQQRILHGGQYFIMHHSQYTDYIQQFDVFFVKFPFSIQRIENALQERIR